MKYLRIALLFFIAMLCQQTFAVQSNVIVTNLTNGWQFLREDLGNVWEAFRPVKAGKPESVPLWSDVKLPHCYNATDAVNPNVNYYEGPAWYRTTIRVDNPYKGCKTILHFNGAGQKTSVYVYTQKVGEHVGGYDEFDVDITNAVDSFLRLPEAKRFNGLIPIAVCCDNSRDREMIPSDMSDFNLYGGLYRMVSLRYLPQNNISELVIMPILKSGTAYVDVKCKSNVRPNAGAALVAVRLLDANGKEVGNSNATNESIGSFSSRINIRHPHLWSPDNPYLYQCKVYLVNDKDTFSTSSQFGIRSFEFVEKGPFLLNGKRLLLRGTHRHEDHAGMGAAVTDSVTKKEFQMMKDMGVNFIRLAHYQQSEYVLHLCDSLGILAWEEIPWCRGGVGGKAYRSQAKRMLRNMINQHRNHPSVILWGLGNEIDWQGDFENYSQDSIRSFLTELNTIAHQEDPSRPTCIRRCDFAKDIVDVYSPTIWAGWYNGTYKDYAKMEKAGFDSTTRFIHAEWGGDSHARRHSEDNFDGLVAGDRNGDWSETYIVKLFDWHLKEQERMPWLTGSAFWTFKDFSTPLRPRNPIPYVNQKGVVERDLTPKESYYVFQSYWTKKPMLHIYGHSWQVRWGKTGEDKELLVYSNCKHVELFVNGVSQGVKTRNSQDFPATGLHWNVKLKDGKNVLKAVAKDKGVDIADSITQQYQTAKWGEPAKISLKKITLQNGKPAIEALLLDKDGNICLDASDFITFGCTDPKGMLVDQGTSTGSSLIQLANGRARIVLLKTKDIAVSAEVTINGKTVGQIMDL